LRAEDRTDSALEDLLYAVLVPDEPSASLLARYAREPESLDAAERQQIEYHKARTPFVRDQIRFLRRLGIAELPARAPAARRRGPARAPRRAIWGRAIAAAVAAGATGVVLMTLDETMRAGTVPTDAQVAEIAQSNALPEATSNAGQRHTATPTNEPPEEAENVAASGAVSPNPALDAPLYARTRPKRPASTTSPAPPPDPNLGPRLQATPERRAGSSSSSHPDVGSRAIDASPRDPSAASKLRAETVVAVLLQVNRAGANAEVDLEIEFAEGSAVLTPTGNRELSEVGRALRDPRLAKLAFVLEAHTDDRGGAEANRALSQQRADTARLFLTNQFEIDPTRIDAIGRGEEDPAVPGDSEAVRQLNRRLTLKRVDPDTLPDRSLP